MKLPWSKTQWQRKQKLAKPGRYYGDGGTIHHTGYLDIETDPNGNVVAVWFRCQSLPFLQTKVGQQRAEEMFDMSRHMSCRISGVEVFDD